VTKTFGGKGYTTGYGYDLSGKKTEATHPGETAVAYEYHGGSNLLWRVSSGGTVFGQCTGYEPTGKMGRLVQGNGTVTRYGYDGKSTRLLSLTTTGKTGEVLQEKRYQYTKAGDLKRITDGLKNVTYDYTYDGLHRLTSERRTKGSDVSTDTWSYDGIGNMTSKRAGGVSFAFGYDKSRPHAVRSVSVNGKVHYLSYDKNGNLVYGPDLSDPSAPGWRALTWTAEGRPEEITYKDRTAPVRVRFEYDGEGKRTKKTVLSLKLTGGTSIDPAVVSETLYVDDAYHITNGRAVKYIFAGTIRVAEIRNGLLSYYHKDHLGSSAVLTDVNGRVVESAEYLPFGELREHGGTWTTDYKFTDQEMDTESGFYNFNARLYDPALGRFVSPDPAVPDLSDPQNQRVYDPQMLNLYAYCRNNPMIYVDPTGLFQSEANEGEVGQYAGEGNNSADSEGNSGKNDEDAAKSEKKTSLEDMRDETEGKKNSKKAKLTIHADPRFDGKFNLNPGHGWVSVNKDDEQTITRGNYMGGPKDDSIRSPGKYSHSWDINPEQADDVLDMVNQPGYSLFNDNCVDRVEDALNTSNISHPDFDTIGISDPEKLCGWLNEIGRKE